MTTSYSVFIPRVFTNIGEQRITTIFQQLDIGDVRKVDLITKENNNGTFNMAFVHFEGLYNTDAAETFRQDVENPEKKAKIVYDDPWFWLVLPFIKKETPIDQTPIQESNFYDNNQPMMTPHQFAPNMVGMWAMTEMGWQWVHYNPQMMVPPQQQQMVPPQQQMMVPPQVLYRNYPPNQQNRQPRKRIRVDGINQSNNQNENNN
tara:strand:- start:348 stop:959 length:612 start_codon:yes stop_codon:yes gene_type:complete